MEIPSIVISKAINASLNSSHNEELFLLLKKLEKENIDHLLNVEKHKSICEVDRQVWELLSKEIHSNSKAEDDFSNRLSKILYTSKYFLGKAIFESDLQSLLIFLFVNCYLKINIQDLYDINFESNSKLSNKVLKILSTFRPDVNKLVEEPYYSKSFLQDISIGFNEVNIKKTYRPITSIEMHGRGFHFNALIENLFDFIFQFDFPSFIKVLNSLGYPESYVFCLQNFGLQKIQKIAEEKSINNKWLNFELIRRIVEKEKSNKFTLNEQNAIRKTLDRIDKEDYNFLKQCIEYFPRSSLFNAALGDYMSSLSNLKIEEIVDYCFIIDRYHHNINARNLFKEKFYLGTIEDKKKVLILIIFKKWEMFYNDFSNAEDSFLSDFLLTDFANFITDYYSIITSDLEIITEINELIKKMKYFDSEWIGSASKQITRFYLYYSRLHLLSFGYKIKQLNDKKILESFKLLINDKIIQKRYFLRNKEGSKQLEIIKNNFSYC